MLPELFLARMKELLGKEYDPFLAALSEEETVHAIRYNPDKITREEIFKALEGKVNPISYAEEGFFCTLSKIGHHPLHHAGAFYSQDPGAMAPLCCLDIQKGWRVADFCASPGGKSTQIAAAIGKEGFLLSNEINAARCRVLAGNIERMGIPNAFVSNLSSKEIADLFDSFFDLVVVDAPCSGEGMFRKYDVAKSEWKPELIPMCAERQAEILKNAAKTVKTGGYLLYSTCTFSVEENEANVDAFLNQHPEFSVCEVKHSVKAVTADGIPCPNASHPEALKRARRFYPHLQPGEGQFMCLLRKEGETLSPCTRYKEASEVTPSKQDMALAKAFFEDTLLSPIEDILPGYNLKKQGEMLCLVPSAAPLLSHRLYMAGVSVGAVIKGRIEPHHHYFSSLGKYFRRRINLAPDSKEIQAYLHGEQIQTELENGYATVCVAGAAVGGVKVVGGVAKNHYPKGLRIP